MRYLRYIAILLWTLFRKVFGLVWYWVVVPFRGYARNVVQNYTLQHPNKVYMPRLLDRKPYLVGNMYMIDPFHSSDGGYIKYRKISTVEFQLVFWLIWGWLDSDATSDTFDKGHNTTIINKERQSWMPEFIIKRLIIANTKCSVYGNSFDLGDKRADNPCFCFWSALLWNTRNTAYNFAYVFDEIQETSRYKFYHRITTKYFDWHFGYIPYTNTTRKGRLVWFSEDIDKVDLSNETV